MKKLLIISITVAVILAAIIVVGEKLEGEKLHTIWGLEFGCSQQEAVSKLRSQGIKCSIDESERLTLNSGVVFSGYTFYADLSFSDLMLIQANKTPDDDKLRNITLRHSGEGAEKIQTTARVIYDALCESFGREDSFVLKIGIDRQEISSVDAFDYLSRTESDWSIFVTWKNVLMIASQHGFISIHIKNKPWEANSNANS